MTLPPLPAGLVRSLALLVGAGAMLAACWRSLLPLVATSDAASGALIVGGSGVLAWAAAQVSQIGRLTAAQSFAAGLTLPISAVLLVSPAATRRAANDNDHPFSGSWPQFISE